MAGERRARILVVDDEPGIVDVVAESLRHSGHEVSTATNGIEALRAIRRGGLDLAVLDVMLPDVDGFGVVSRMRSEGLDVPVLFLTARTEGEDAAHGLQLGADDYVRKPFHVDELVARVRAVLRIRQASSSGPEVLSFADIRLDLRTYRAHRRDRPIALTPTELRLLEVLLTNPGRIMTRSQLVDRVWDEPGAVDVATLETAVSRLRRKLSAAGEADLLVTRRGVGYGFVAEPVPSDGAGPPGGPSCR